jgi:hypothetical protein
MLGRIEHLGVLPNGQASFFLPRFIVILSSEFGNNRISLDRKYILFVDGEWVVFLFMAVSDMLCAFLYYLSVEYFVLLN